ncbi:hypothetical protein CC80DRAFT_557529 [Byssothecium circinans]|uniref:Uncharacterized protein n=1 Tax=Byssothecium circinans TaxID=147558 RepID=A0A6A5UH59_9PLEO|nr:hypothetical protein CC80DRAFT_557529 [Byssothecium circinans]
MPLKQSKRARNSAAIPKPHKRAKIAARGTSTQPIELDNTQLTLLQRLSPRATFKSRFRESQNEDSIVPPTKGSDAATIATTDVREPAKGVNEDGDKSLDVHLEDDFNGLDFKRILKYIKPLATQRAKRSWVYLHGYRVALLKEPN